MKPPMRIGCIHQPPQRLRLQLIQAKPRRARLLSNSPGRFEGNEFKAHCLRLDTEFDLLAFVIAQLMGGESAVVELLACDHQVEDDPGQLVGSSRDGFRSAKLRSHTSIQITERALTVVEGAAKSGPISPNRV
jgi:hypothetical protein